jgi:hypothetical protein
VSEKRVTGGTVSDIGMILGSAKVAFGLAICGFDDDDGCINDIDD